MDVELARSFLEIVSSGSFIRASERLNVAQTTVSARIRSLEQQLGRQLFVRHKGGASLTPAGEQFLRHAPMFVQLWQRTLHQVAVPPGSRAVLTVGSEISIAEPLLLDWVRWMRQSLPDIALHVHVDVPQDLIDQVASGLVDVAIMYAPQHRPGLKIDLLMEEKLVLVTTDLEARLAGSIDYAHIDWGPDFTFHHGMNFPDVAPDLFMDLGPLALSYILSVGGSGYFRMSAVQPHIEAGRLHLVPETPQFSYPAYAVQSANADEAVVAPAMAGLHSVLNGDAFLGFPPSCT
ncbi:LysR family transcriptional regulator [Mesorhizobium sp. M7A.F.Ca.US.006.04.2.1]|nr:LysR family transcriptional regulator [Mesorhizobium sp. M7A.F.Ca.US.005.03.1.1]RUY14497.1 LysR family transcriptional regulator [Mesorhizobium sp. M7A.F.Ca.US.005.03.2.1]RUY25295.1 LysR family transcriptional regulator [Mesorhizobium sp. M7A.F.Ca.US.001.04.2.1]RUY42215.1 LysR family transcriptional regulator [Mesorhizobium sp. M7A.F.Ca.US.001.04.1.1]RUY99051.1 LysR family transcriptional regulator [Mesorhizobium sp. M7A.F.Ca.CA.001.12.2.1]RUZ27410.1 LysR family transcriptional regulator [M